MDAEWTPNTPVDPIDDPDHLRPSDHAEPERTAPGTSGGHVYQGFWVGTFPHFPAFELVVLRPTGEGEEWQPVARFPLQCQTRNNSETGGYTYPDDPSDGETYFWNYIHQESIVLDDPDVYLFNLSPYSDLWRSYAGGGWEGEIQVYPGQLYIGGSGQEEQLWAVLNPYIERYYDFYRVDTLRRSPSIIPTLTTLLLGGALLLSGLSSPIAGRQPRKKT